MLELRIFGTVQLRHAEDGRAFHSILTQPKRIALLIYLALARPHGLRRRDELLGIFWPDLPQDRARAALRQALYVLRRTLGDGILLTRGDEEVGVDRARLACDAVLFTEALDSGERERALELYRGPPLNGFHLDGAPEFERWLADERAALRRRALDAALALVDERRSAGHPIEAVKWARRALEIEPLEERGARALITSLTEAGDRAAALDEYDRYRERLAAELEIEPGPETAGLAARIRETADAPARPTARDPATPGATRDTLSADAPASTSTGTQWRRWAAVAAALAVGAVILVSFASRLTGDRPDLGDARILVVPFENRGSDHELDGIGPLAAEWITQGLVRSALVDVVPSMDALASLRRLDHETGERGPALTQRLSEEMGARLVISGSYHREADTLVFQLQIGDMQRREVLRGVDDVRGPVEDAGALVRRLRDRAVGALATVVDERLAAWSRSASLPPDYRAYRFFIEGIDAHVNDAFDEARDLFRAAWSLDSTFVTPLIWSYFAERNDTDPETDGSTVIEHLKRTRSRLGPFDGAFADYALAHYSRDWSAGVEAARRMVAIAPASEWHYKLARVEYRVRRYDRTIEILEAIDPSRGWIARYPSYWTLLLEAYHLSGDCASELSTAERALHHYPSRVAFVRRRARALACLGRTAESVAIIEALMRPRAATGPPQGNTWAVIAQIVSELRIHGRPDAAAELADRALAEWPSDSGVDSLHAATLLIHLGRLVEADRTLAALARDRIDRPHPIVHGLRGLIAARHGDRDRASAIARRLSVNDGEQLRLRALILAELGDRESAIRLLADDYTDLTRMHELAAFESLGDDPEFERLLAPVTLPGGTG